MHRAVSKYLDEDENDYNLELTTQHSYVETLSPAEGVKFWDCKHGNDFIYVMVGKSLSWVVIKYVINFKLG